MAKDKKNKNGKKKSKAEAPVLDRIKSLTDNALLADVVAAALVATASALKDTNKARRYASEAGDQLEKLSKEGSERGSAMWQLALDIGRRALSSAGSETPARSTPAKSKAPKTPKAPKAPKAPRATKRLPAKAGRLLGH